MVIHIDAPRIWHDCYGSGVPRVDPWYWYKAIRTVWNDIAKWKYSVIKIQVIFCPVCGVNLEEAYQAELKVGS